MNLHTILPTHGWQNVQIKRVGGTDHGVQTRYFYPRSTSWLSPACILLQNITRAIYGGIYICNLVREEINFHQIRLDIDHHRAEFISQLFTGTEEAAFLVRWGEQWPLNTQITVKPIKLTRILMQIYADYWVMIYFALMWGSQTVALRSHSQQFHSFCSQSKCDFHVNVREEVTNWHSNLSPTFLQMKLKCI